MFILRMRPLFENLKPLRMFWPLRAFRTLFRFSKYYIGITTDYSHCDRMDNFMKHVPSYRKYTFLKRRIRIWEELGLGHGNANSKCH